MRSLLRDELKSRQYDVARHGVVGDGWPHAVSRIDEAQVVAGAMIDRRGRFPRGDVPSRRLRTLRFWILTHVTFKVCGSGMGQAVD